MDESGHLAPIPASQLAKHAAEATAQTERPASRDGQAAKSFYVIGSAETPTPKVKVEPVDASSSSGGLWRVTVDVQGAQESPLLGRGVSEVAARVRASASHSKRGVASFRPKGAATAVKPKTERPVGLTLHEFRGRRYRPLYVFGSDDRHVLTDTSWPWLCVGKVETSDGTSGSGALVGGRVMLTARHVRPARSIEAGSWWMKFTPHKFDGMEPFGSSFVSDLHSFKTTGDSEFDVAHDYMVCRLYEPLGERLGFFGAAHYSDDWEDDGVWASVGYPDQIASGGRPVVELNASIEEDYSAGDGLVLETEADLTPGNSGGPFWAWFDGMDPRIVAVTSGEMDFATSLGLVDIHDHDNALAGGPAMVDIVRWARDHYK